ncbi:helix-turn-helix domain-containing protein [Pedobacter sp. B4-66]|uniref:helix-turn-helix domain-containing protein n=1 Tax=Pedobacter sp. B4-66 TaxID=2817280 RepID=UPI001BD9C5A9|nr:helix-turn-helix domain-containing protein [Pedobacter sp. B4-66]
MKANTGEIVELVIRRKNINISKLSRRMEVNRSTLYSWFKQKQLPIEVIRAIGKAIDHDFSEEFRDEFNKRGSSDIGHSPLNPATIEQDNNQEIVTYWMQKYIILLEEYNAAVNHLHKISPKQIKPMKSA